MNKLEQIARQIVLADVNGTLLPTLDSPLSVSDAYAVQNACTQFGQSYQRIVKRKYETVGYKIGATSQEIQDVLGLSEPFYGPLYAGAACWSDQEIAQVEFSAYMQHTPRVEAEFVVSLKNHLVRGEKDFQIDDILDHIDWIAPGLEFVGSRFEKPQGSPGTSVIADLGANQFMAVGKAYKNWQELDLTKLPVSLGFTNADQISKQWPEPVVQGHSGMSVFGNPLLMVCWLLNHETMRGVGIKAGEWISCGTCTGALHIVEENNITAADFGKLGKLVAKANIYHNPGPVLT